MAGPWPGLQFPDGTFPDYLHGDLAPRSTRYGEAMLGYGLLATGLREADSETIDAGLRALRWFVRQTDLQRDHPSVFAHAAVASAYNLARREAASRPLFAGARDDWERWLRRVRLLWLPATTHYANKYLVEAVAVLELLDAELEAGATGTVLDQRADARRRAEHLVNEHVPALAERGAFAVGDKRAYFLSDPEGGNPLAYQGLSFGMYARALALLGATASEPARTTLRLVGRASWGLMGPDGDVAYAGRSQEQAWALALTAYGAEAAVELAGASAAAHRPLARRALTRLRDEHGTGPRGLFLTPSLREDLRDHGRGVDSYAGVIGYAGLTLVAANWATDVRDEDGAPPDAPPADPLAARYALEPEKTGFAVVRRPRLWFAVRTAAKTVADDLRYDFGLVALKAPRGDGRWGDVLRPRPYTHHGADSAGPVLRRSAGPGLPAGERLAVAGDGTVVVHGGFRTLGGEWLRRGVAFRFEPDGDRVRLAFPTQRGDRFKFSAFFRAAGPRPRVTDHAIEGDGQRVGFNPSATVAFDDDVYASGRDARLIRANLFFPASDGGPIHITVGPA